MKSLIPSTRQPWPDAAMKFYAKFRQFRECKAEPRIELAIRLDDDEPAVEPSHPTRPPIVRRPVRKWQKPPTPEKPERDDSTVIETLVALGLKKSDASRLASVAVGNTDAERVANALSRRRMT